MLMCCRVFGSEAVLKGSESDIRGVISVRASYSIFSGGLLGRDVVLYTRRPLCVNK